MARVVSGDSKRFRRPRRLYPRTCLRCDRDFLSEGAHNRLCDRCRELLAASSTPLEEYPLGYL
jgi:hypothetical protein